MDKDFVKKNNLDEAVERFRRISEYVSPAQSLKKLYEYTFVSKMNEEGEDDAQQPDMQQPQEMPQGDPNQMGGMEQQQGGDMGAEAPQMPQDGQLPAEPQGDGMEAQPEDAPVDVPMPEEDDVETEEMEPDDEVVDVDDLTQSQEATEYKVDGVDDKLSKLYAVVQKFSDQLDKNEQSIMALKDEFEKRNPTQTEKFYLRSQASGPFNQTASDYWDKVSKENPNYEVIRDNDTPPADEEKNFEIKKSDIDGINMKEISDTLDIDQKLGDYLAF